MTENTLIIILAILLTLYGVLCWVWDILRDRAIAKKLDSLISGTITDSNTITDTFVKICKLYEEHKKISVNLNDKYHTMSHDLQQIKHRLDTIKDKQDELLADKFFSVGEAELLKKPLKKRTAALKKRLEKLEKKTVFQEPTDYVIKGNKNYMPEAFKGKATALAANFSKKLWRKLNKNELKKKK